MLRLRQPFTDLQYNNVNLCRYYIGFVVYHFFLLTYYTSLFYRYKLVQSNEAFRWLKGNGYCDCARDTTVPPQSDLPGRAHAHTHTSGGGYTTNHTAGGARQSRSLVSTTSDWEFQLCHLLPELQDPATKGSQLSFSEPKTLQSVKA